MKDLCIFAVHLDKERYLAGEPVFLMWSTYRHGFYRNAHISSVKGREFSAVTGYEALALEVEDTFKVLGELKQPEYELALLAAICGTHSLPV